MQLGDFFRLHQGHPSRKGRGVVRGPGCAQGAFEIPRVAPLTPAGGGLFGGRRGPLGQHQKGQDARVGGRRQKKTVLLQRGVEVDAPHLQFRVRGGHRDGGREVHVFGIQG
jgi:hypothetical protein